MYNIPLIENTYQKFIKNINFWIPEEGIYVINLDLLLRLDLLHFHPSLEQQKMETVRFFHIIESFEKITLIDNDFVIWIIPDKSQQTPLTYVLIALNKGNHEPQLEAVLIATGIYNTSRLVLKSLEKLLIDIEETEKTISKLQNST